MDLSELLRQYGAGDGNSQDQDVEGAFDQVAGQLPSNALSGGLAEAFRSDQTPPFASMLGGLFGNSNGSQQASVLNSLLAVVGPMIMQRMMSGGGAPVQQQQEESGLGGILGSIFGGGAAPQRASGGGGLEAILGGAVGSGALGGILQGMMGSGGLRQLTPSEAARISPEEVQALAETAQEQDGGIIDQMSDFYSEHPTLVKTLGAGALALALSKIAQSQRD